MRSKIVIHLTFDVSTFYQIIKFITRYFPFVVYLGPVYMEEGDTR